MIEQGILWKNGLSRLCTTGNKVVTSTPKSTYWVWYLILSSPKQEGVRTQMRVSGVSAGRYWGCHLIIDCTQMYAIALVGVIAIVVIGLALGNSSLFTVGGLFFFIVFMLLFLPMYAMFAYCISFIFTEYQSAQSGSQLFFTWVSVIRYWRITLLFWRYCTGLVELRK